jgi:hypothetical protein
MNKYPGFRQNITKLILDLLIFIGFLLALDPRVTGIAIHEWLAIAGSAAVILHLLLNWNWIPGLTRRMFRKVALKPRLNYILNWLFFIDGVLVMLTGIMISEVVLPLLGLQVVRDSGWRQLHSLTADLSLFILALHLALNWDWVVKVTKCYMLQPIASLGRKREVVPVRNEVRS